MRRCGEGRGTVRVAWAVEACRLVTVAVWKGLGSEGDGALERSCAGVRR